MPTSRQPLDALRRAHRVGRVRFAALSAVATSAVCALLMTGCPTNLEDMEPTTVIECGRASVPNEDNTECEALVAPSIKSEEVEFPSLPTPGGQTMLRGTLALPDWGAGAKPSKNPPVVIFVPGAGPMDRSGLVDEDTTGLYKAPVAVIQDLAEGLAQQGYATLRYDKRTCTPDLNPLCTSSPEIASAATWSDFVGDVAAAANFVTKRQDVDAEDLIAVGYDQGGIVLLEAAPQITTLRDIVLIATPYEPADVALVRRITWKIETNEDAYTKEQLNELQKHLSVVQSGLLAIKQGYMPEGELFLGSKPAFWLEYIDATSAIGAHVQSTKQPILYVRGANDVDTSADDQERFAEAIKGRGASRAVALPAHDHALVAERNPGEVSKLALKTITDWLGRSSGQALPPSGDGRVPTVEALE